MTDLQILAAALEELQRRKDENKHAYLFQNRDEYPKHIEFFKAGKEYKQRLFRAANRVGKTTAAGYELVCHLTGIYPDWWEGHRFSGATSWWVCGKSGETIRQILQPLLLGEVGHFGTGLIPAASLDFDSLKDAKKASTPISTIRVKHYTGAFSQIEFKAYEQGRASFEGTERNIWCDEEPPEDVYSECLLRTMTGGCILMMTFTPLKGASKVVMGFSKDGIFDDGEVGLGKYVVTASWDDVPHLLDSEKAMLWESIPPYQRDARSKGVPSLGSGAIYPVPEDQYLVEPFKIPDHWPRLYGMDVGGKTAAVWLAKDPDTNLCYVYTSYYQERQEPSIHAAAIKGRGDWIPGAIDPASRGRSQIDGEQLMQMYRDLGLKVQNADNAVETGLYEIWEALSTGTLKVFIGQPQFMREIRGYARDEKGRVIKANDHCFVAGTMVDTLNGPQPIESLTEGVLHSFGAQQFRNARKTAEQIPVVTVMIGEKQITCTPDHRFLTTHGWIPAMNLVGYDVLQLQDTSWTPQSFQEHSKNSTETCTTSPVSTSPRISMERLDDCIELCSSITAGQSPTGGTCITWTETLRTTGETTFKLSLRPITCENIILESRTHSQIYSAVLSTSPLTVDLPCAVSPAVLVRSEVCSAVLNAGTADVYCLEVPGTATFSVAGGVLVHNCMDAFRYAYRTRDIAKTKLSTMTNRDPNRAQSREPIQW